MTSIHHSFEPTINITQRLSLSKSLVLSLSILSLNSYELFRRIEEEALSNPVLLFSNKKALNEYFSSHNIIPNNHSNVYDDFLENITNQIEYSHCSLEKKIFLKDVIQNFLDEKFFLKKIDFLKKYKLQKYQIWLRHLKILKSPGIAAAHLQERFKHQLEFYFLKKTLAYQIVDECWKHFLSKNTIKIQRLLKKSENEIKFAIDQIKSFCKPNIIELDSPENSAVLTHPDIILKTDGSLELNERYLPKLKINENLINLAKPTTDPKTHAYIKDKINQAKNILMALERRNQTLLNIASIVIDLQKEYIKNNHSPFIRLTLKDISLKTKYSQSTISRALKGKSILTPHGIKMIEYFLRPLTSR